MLSPAGTLDYVIILAWTGRKICTAIWGTIFIVCGIYILHLLALGI